MMGYNKFCFVILAVAFCDSILCIPREPTNHVAVDIDSSHVVFQVDPAFYSVGLGCNLHFDTEYNLSSPVLRRLARELTPAYVRLGGSYCDFLIFRSDPDELQKEFKNKTLSGKLWDDLNDFVSSVGFRFLFDANILLRTPGNEWDPSNFLCLLRYNADRGYKVDFQLGNEPNMFPHKFNMTITPEALAEDFKMLRTILKQRKFYQDSSLIGPDNTDVLKSRSLDYLQGFLENIGDAVDGISTHFYYRYDPSEGRSFLEFFTDPLTLDQFSANTDTFVDIVRKYGQHLNKPKIWYGESGLLPGGQNLTDISDRFISGMVWLDKLGICALKGVDVIVRQTLLANSGRRLITTEGDPTADYWGAVLYKRLVGTDSLKVSKFGEGDGMDKLRLYAHCAQTNRSRYGYKPGVVTVFGVNFNLNKTVHLEFKARNVDQFLLTPARTTNVTSLYIALNGQELYAQQGVLPDLLPLPVTSKPTFPPGSMGFFVLKDAEFKICKK